jgi:predicted transposase YbfD/YdcC
MRVHLSPAALQSLPGAMSLVVDPRIARTRKHSLATILVIALLGTIADCDAWDDLAEWAEEQHDWLATFLDLTHGTPSADTIRRVFEALDRSVFAEASLAWARSFLPAGGAGTTVSLDGKTMRGSASPSRALHVVHAWCVEDRLLLGQLDTDSKSNETATVPELLAALNLEGVTVTGNAANTYRPIAQQIVEQNGDYVLAVRGNQPRLEEQIVLHFAPHVNADLMPAGIARHVEVREGHGRVVEQTVWVAPASVLEDVERWAGAKTIVYVRSRRIEATKSSEEWRPYVSSREGLSPADFLGLIRSHRGVENDLHWQLDVSFREDANRIRDRNAAVNLSLLRALALGLLERETSDKRGIDAKRKKASRRVAYLIKVLVA